MPKCRWDISTVPRHRWDISAGVDLLKRCKRLEAMYCRSDALSLLYRLALPCCRADVALLVRCLPAAPPLSKADLLQRHKRLDAMAVDEEPVREEAAGCAEAGCRRRPHQSRVPPALARGRRLLHDLISKLTVVALNMALGGRGR